LGEIAASRAEAVGGGRRLDRFENDFDMWGDCGCLGEGGCDLRRGLLAVGVRSKLSLRGDIVGSSNSKAKFPGEVGAGLTGEVVMIVGGLAFLSSVGDRIPLEQSIDDLEAGSLREGEASSLEVCLSAGEA